MESITLVTEFANRKVAHPTTHLLMEENLKKNHFRYVGLTVEVWVIMMRLGPSEHSSSKCLPQISSSAKGRCKSFMKWALRPCTVAPKERGPFD